MLPEFDAAKTALTLSGSLGILTGLMSWFRKGSQEEDSVVSNAARELLNGISDADLVGKVEDQTKLNLRDQVTLEEAQDWAKDRDLRGFWRRN